MGFEAMWGDLAPVGRSAASGGYHRQPFTRAGRECAAWFEEQATARDLRLERDGNGNLVAWWGEGPDAVVTGSHLDSVVDGGAYDGPLGVVSALAAVDLLRERGVRPRRPLGVAVFVEEEGSRFGLACLGSRLAVGAITAERAAALTDPLGTRLDEAMAAAGVEPELGRSRWLDRVGAYVELHVEQGRDLVHRDAAVGVGSRIWPHGRYRFDFAGVADHAGATRMGDRHDPMLTYAMTALAANKQARLQPDDLARATFGRVEVAPNATNAVPSGVTAWLDARCDTEERLSGLVEEIARQARQRAERDGTAVHLSPESVSPAVTFDADLTSRVAAAAGSAPVIPTAAGHDAGVLAAAGIPATMLFVRNPTGVSHSPAEHAGTADCLAGVEALAGVLEELLA
ncbi:MAG: allantoate amidohydrolase [Marmoricola sp.]